MIRIETAGSRVIEDSRPQPLEHDLPQAVVFNALALVLAPLMLYLFYSHPVVYTWFVAEDHFGENIQAIGFAATAVLMLVLAWRPGPLPRRILWALIGLVALFVAGEEISWGERILEGVMGISYPDAVRELNRQDEFNIHNLMSQSLLTSKQNIAALGIVVWLGISFVVIGWWPQLAQRLDHYGVPLIPVQFYGLFLVAVGYRFAGPVARSDEIWELFLALAAVSWAFHLYLRHRWPRAAVGRRGVGALAALFGALVLSGAVTAPIGSHDLLTARYNSLASRDYPARGLYGQADELFAHIYRHPEHEYPDTRHEHARLLLAQGRDDEAAVVLTEVIRRAGEKETREDLTILDLRGLAMAYAALQEPERAHAYFERAIEVNRAKIADTEDADEKALLHWELARTLKAAGDVEGAITAVEAGVGMAASAAPAAGMETWLRVNVLTDWQQDRRSYWFWQRVSCWLSPGGRECNAGG
jgi:tetratricopeptide (TPR) repeat protein